MSTILLSFPRSGNHLVRFILEFLTLRRTRGCIGNYEDVAICKNKFEDETVLAQVDTNAPFIAYKHHGIPEIMSNIEQRLIHKPERLILVLRDWRECILKDHTVGENICGPINSYLENIKYYDEFSGEKILIYYEDLITKPEEMIQKLNEFVGGIEEQYNKLVSNVSYYFEQNRKATSWTQEGKCSGSDIHFRVKKLSKSEKESFESFFWNCLTNFPTTFKYIDHYQI